MPRGIIALVFRAKITGGSLATNDETAAFRWTTAGELRDYVREAYAVRVLDALIDSDRPCIRAHDGVSLL